MINLINYHLKSADTESTKTLQIKLFRNRPKKEVRRKSRAEVDMASSEEDDDSDQSEKGNKKRNKDYDSSNRLETSV